MSDTPTIQFTWSIANLERHTADGIVYTVHHRVDATDGVYSSGAYGSIGLEAPADGDSVIPYSGLTEYADQAAAVAGGVPTGGLYKVPGSGIGSIRVVV